jgi:toxin HigB-1
MIQSFKHKGLKRFFEMGVISGINTSHIRRLKIILQRLNAATHPQDMDTPGMKFHKLLGDLSGFYSVSVNANWRIIFRFVVGHVTDVDYIDYH